MCKNKICNKSFSLLLILTLFITLLGIVSLPMTAYALNTTYYVDPNGSDSNNGTSPSTPWRTLDKVESVVFQPGDHILFKAGSSFTGGLILQGNGASGNPIVIDMYGAGSKPAIIGDASVSSVIQLLNKEYWEINNLDITSNQNNDPGNPSGQRAGIYVWNNSGTTKHHIYVKNCYVHDIFSTLTYGPMMYGGIFYDIWGAGSKYEDIQIQNNTVYNSSGCGIQSRGYDPVTNDWGPTEATQGTGFIVSGNTIDTTRYDGMIIGTVNGALIENNVVRNSCTSGESFFAGLWIVDASNTTVQKNEVYLTHVNLDGMGYDDDMWTSNNTFQYNYSHDNGGGFMLDMMQDPGLKVRYNISQNDGTRIFKQANASFYNNTIYIPSGSTTAITAEGSGSAKFINNIIYNLGSGGYDGKGTFINNCYYGNHPTSEPSNDIYRVFNDPKLVNPGGAGVGIGTCTAYKLQSTSPCINAGIDMGEGGNKDFFENTIPAGMHNIGADETYATGGTSAQIGLKANASGKYVVAENMGNDSLIANRTSVGDWEKFNVVYLADGYVALKSRVNGKYVTADVNGATPLIANSTTVGTAQKFTLVDAGSGFVALRANINSKYVCADNYGTEPLINNRTAVGDWEKFRIYYIGNKTIKANSNNKYTCADIAGTPSYPLIANRTAVGDWEKFHFSIQSDGSTAIIANSNNKYVCAENNGNNPLVNSKTTVSTSEKFTVFYQSNGKLAYRANINSKYVTADPAGVNPLIASKTTIGSAELFIITDTP